MDLSIRMNSNLATLVVVFVVEPENQEKLIQVLKDGLETVMSKQAGCIAASFLKSKDGRHVISYAQWSSLKDIETPPDRSNPEVDEYFNRVRELAQIKPIVCDVAYVHHV